VTAVWLTVAVVGAVSVATKGTGPILLGGRRVPSRVRAVIALLAPTLLAALIATQIFSGEHHLQVDSRAVGLGVGATALVLRAPILLAVVLASLATALARAVLHVQ
jgi:branched-subunit amino acid transport protein